MTQPETRNSSKNTLINQDLRLRVSILAILLAVLPTLLIHVNYLIAASEGVVPWCNPYWDSCTSISATGRSGIAFYFFKATMLPVAAVYWLYWINCNRILRSLGNYNQLIKYLGTTAVLAFIVYVLALGAVGDAFQLSRRIGIILYFTLTYLCQLLIASNLISAFPQIPALRVQQGLLGLILLIGLLTLALDGLMNDYDSIEDAFEWIIALLLHVNFLVAAAFWKSSFLDKGKQ